MVPCASGRFISWSSGGWFTPYREEIAKEENNNTPIKYVEGNVMKIKKFFPSFTVKFGNGTKNNNVKVIEPPISEIIMKSNLLL